MANIVPVYVDAIAIITRQAEANQNIPAAQWEGGANAAASNANGIGIGTQAGLDESLPNWTLLDQAEAARTPQTSSIIGAISGVTAIDIVTNDASGNGDVTIDGEATLAALATGWVAV